MSFWLFVWTVKIPTEDFGHLEHVYLILLEHSSHGRVTNDLSFVFRILKIVFAYVLPQSFHRLRTGKLLDQHNLSGKLI
jgi:hypothetical protein